MQVQQAAVAQSVAARPEVLPLVAAQPAAARMPERAVPREVRARAARVKPECLEAQA
jgi:hypothetical protein